MGRIVVFDLETVPDLTVSRRVLGLDDGTGEDEVRRALDERYARSGQSSSRSFVKPPLHRIVCIGALYADQEGDGPWKVRSFGARHLGDRSEAALIILFLRSLMPEPSPRLVGFNSAAFDLPVLRYRALSLGISAGAIHASNGRNYWYRFGPDHLDLCDALSGFRGGAQPSLVELGCLLDIPVKTSGIGGSLVEEYANNRQFADIGRYCEEDVLTTYMIFLRYMLVTGAVDSRVYSGSMDACEYS